MPHSSLIVTGAEGRIGRALRVLWGNEVAGQAVLWSARRPAQGIDIAWNIGSSPPPPLPQAPIFLHLAGQTSGDAATLAENRHSAAALSLAARASHARHVFFLSTSAVYRPSPRLIDEAQTPDPISDYGHAKLAAENALRDLPPAIGLTILRLGNLAGADSLLSNARLGPVLLDPIPGQPGGPERSYIGPNALAATLEQLIALATQRQALPDNLNLALDPPLAMADLLTAYGADWRFGPPREAAIPRVALSVARLKGYVDLAPASAKTVVDDLNSIKALWP